MQPLWQISKKAYTGWKGFGGVKISKKKGWAVQPPLSISKSAYRCENSQRHRQLLFSHTLFTFVFAFCLIHIAGFPLPTQKHIGVLAVLPEIICLVSYTYLVFKRLYPPQPAGFAFNLDKPTVLQESPLAVGSAIHSSVRHGLIYCIGYIDKQLKGGTFYVRDVEHPPFAS